MMARTAVAVVMMEVGACQGESAHEGSGGEDGAEKHRDLLLSVWDLSKERITGGKVLFKADIRRWCGFLGSE